MYGSVENSIVEISYNVGFSIIIILKEVFTRFLTYMYMIRTH